MYYSLIIIHSIVRWLVVVTLLYAVYRAYMGYKGSRLFSKTDNFIRHTTATIAHIQLIVGILLYSKSPVVKHFLIHPQNSEGSLEPLFFGVLHITAMLVAIVLITVGSSLAKRKDADVEKFKTMFWWFCAAVILIFIAIPWPFSPLAQRPFIRF